MYTLRDTDRSAPLGSTHGVIPKELDRRRVVMLGDSFGVGMAQAGGLYSQAIVGATYDRIPYQLNKVTVKNIQVVIISLGTNEAAANMRDIPITWIVEQVRRVTPAPIIILGPPCLTSPGLNARAHYLDRELEMTVPAAGARYLSMRQFCPPKGDGIHDSPAGYAKRFVYIWNYLLKQAED